MSDLISREAAIALAKDIVVGEYRHRCIDPDNIRELPAIDAVQGVRCKDCKYNPKNPRLYDDDDLIFCFDWCWYLAGEDGFCSKGRRQ